MRGGTFIREKKKQKKMNHVDAYYVGMSREQAHKETLDILCNHPKLDFIFNRSIDVSFGVSNSLKKSEKISQIKSED
ncbi:MAG: hypothetical protein JKX94_12270 [Sneathiella sp.]|nr:hypothetical protein [Sneathiella sp.]